MIVDVGGERLFVPQPHDPLLRKVGSSPVHLQGDLIRLHQDPFSRILPVKEEVDVTSGLGRIGPEVGILVVALPQLPGLANEFKGPR